MFASKTIRRFAAGIILLTCAAATAPGQSSGLSPLAQAAMERALQRIASEGQMIPSLIYTGMRYSEVRLILGYDFEIELPLGGPAMAYWYSNHGALGVSIHGPWVILWTGSSLLSRDTDPTVIGYSSFSDTRVWQNRLR